MAMESFPYDVMEQGMEFAADEGHFRGDSDACLRELEKRVSYMPHDE